LNVRNIALTCRSAYIAARPYRAKTRVIKDPRDWERLLEQMRSAPYLRAVIQSLDIRCHLSTRPFFPDVDSTLAELLSGVYTLRFHHCYLDPGLLSSLPSVRRLVFYRLLPLSLSGPVHTPLPALHVHELWTDGSSLGSIMWDPKGDLRSYGLEHGWASHVRLAINLERIRVDLDDYAEQIGLAQDLLMFTPRLRELKLAGVRNWPFDQVPGRMGSIERTSLLPSLPSLAPSLIFIRSCSIHACLELAPLS
jgi:hypothetical protein